MTCFLCGRNGASDPLDRHHIFNGPYKRKCEKYGCVVRLCHFRCHKFGKYAVHNNYESMLFLKKLGQEKIMREQGWDRDKFIKEFGRDYKSKYEEEYGYVESH